ncbi:hypothetical protein ACKX2D_05290 [Lachnospiraceae bacterium YH-ros2226]
MALFKKKPKEEEMLVEGLSDTPTVQNLHLKEKKEKGQYVYAIIGVVVALGIFCGLVYLERYINTPKSSTMTVIAKTEIPRGTVLTKDNWKDFLTGINMDDTYRPKDALSSVNDLIDTKTTVDIGKGSILSTKETVSTKDVENTFTDPVEVSLSISAENADAGLLRKGDLVNFVKTEDGDDGSGATAGFALENIYVKNAFDGDGKAIDTSDRTTRASMLQILLNRSDQPAFTQATNGGKSMAISRVVDTQTGYEKILQKDKANQDVANPSDDTSQTDKSQDADTADADQNTEGNTNDQ